MTIHVRRAGVVSGARECDSGLARDHIRVARCDNVGNLGSSTKASSTIAARLLKLHTALAPQWPCNGWHCSSVTGAQPTVLLLYNGHALAPLIPAAAGRHAEAHGRAWGCVGMRG